MITKIKGATAHVKHFKLKLTAMMLALICCTATTVFAASNTVTTYVYCEDEITKVVSFTTQPEEIVSRAQIELEQEDKLSLDNYQEGTDDSVIYVYKAHNVTINDDGKRIELCAAGSVADALEKAGLTLELGDKININENVFLTEGMEIKINRAFGVTVIADSNSQSFNVTKGVVSDALELAGVTVGKYDTVSYANDTLLRQGMKIVVKRVIYRARAEYETVDYNTVTVKSADMYNDQSEVTQQGVDGQNKLTYLDKYVDGVYHSTSLKKTQTVKKPVTKIVTVGTKNRPIRGAKPAATTGTISWLSPSTPIELDSNGRPVNYKRLITGKATAYNGGTVTSTGVSPMPGRVAVNPRQIPYGTKMYIISSDGQYVYGYAVAADTGGFTWNGSGTLIDLYMSSYSQCINFGRRTVEVYIL